ncbi:MAG: class I SAM-dependent methyltransferase [Propionibacteriaceae bacterium]|nr:class I SAM-dependent methyltransferase [Propionibacteriaceae bacterium]
MSKHNAIPPEALTWLAAWPHARTLAVHGGAALARRLLADGHTVFAMAADEPEVDRLRAATGATPVWARPEALPLDPWQFDVVLSHQGFHTMDLSSALPEIARVLRPGGCLSASYIVRDDSVPWVRRLAALLRHYDPVAMRGDYGHDSLKELQGSKYFPEVEQRAFRIWQKVSLRNLQLLVARQPLSARLDDAQRARLAAEVRELYVHSVRPGEQLRLPFQLLCCRAWVSHEELTSPVTAPDTGIKIHV